MKIYSKYLVKQIVYNILISFLILFVVFSLLKLIGEVGKIGTNNYGFLEAFVYVIMHSPLFITSIGPLSVLLGSMNSSRYFQILQIGQISQGGMLLKFLQVGLVSMLFFFTLSELISPVADRWSEYYRQIAIDGRVNISRNGENMWFKNGDTYIFLGKKEKSNLFHDIQIINPDNENGTISFTFADKGNINNKVLFVEDAKIFTANVNSPIYSLTQESRKNSANELGISADFIENINVNPAKLSLIFIINKLWNSLEGENTSKFSIELFSRIFQPIFLLIAMLFTIPKFFSNSRNFSMGKVIFSAIFIGILVNIINRFIVIAALRWELDIYFYTTIFIAFVLSFGLNFFKKINKIQ